MSSMIEALMIMGWLLPLTFILGGLLVGFLIEKIIQRSLRKISSRTEWAGTEIVNKAIRGKVILSFVIAGSYGAILKIPMNPELSRLLLKILLILVLFLVTVVLARVSVGFVNLSTRRLKGVLPSTSIFANLTRLFIFLLGTLIILQSLGISITPLLTALGVGGLAVALALQGTLSNLFSGLQIIASRQVKPGDYVKLDTGEAGYVADITWRNTTIRALPNNMYVVPNSKLASAIVTNYYQPDQELAVLVQVGVSYRSDLGKVEQVTVEVAKEVMREIPGGISEFEPFIRYHTFSDFSINFSVIMRGREFVDQYLIKHEFIKRLHDRYEKEDIEIPFPIRTVYMQEKRK